MLRIEWGVVGVRGTPLPVMNDFLTTTSAARKSMPPLPLPSTQQSAANRLGAVKQKNVKQ